MSRPATARLKMNPPLGRMPVLQFCAPSELQIDDSYQRMISADSSKTLIRRIAQHWNWDLCQPLVVARRADSGGLFVIDGQHRLEAAKQRGDIAQLPCVIGDFASIADEAASFVHLNQQRRPLGKLDVFRAAVASEDPESSEIAAALAYAGLCLAPHTNYTTWKPGMVSHIGGIQSAWRRHGAKVTTRALEALGRAYPGEVLRYAGTIFPGLVAVCADQMLADRTFDGSAFERFHRWIGRRPQTGWRIEIARYRAEQPSETFGGSSAAVFLREWRKEPPSDRLPPPKAAPRVAPRPAPVSPIARPSDGKAFCAQCDRRVHLSAASLCKDRFCKVRPSLTRAG